jgi:hypothetical protein
MFRLYRLTCLLALLLGGAWAVQAQDLRTREDDGGRPEEDNISGYHYTDKDVVLFQNTLNGETDGAYDADEAPQGADPQRIRPGAFDLDAALTVYPNPVSTVMKIELTEMLDVSISLHSLVGKEVYRHQGRLQRHDIPVHDIQAGVYFVRLCFGDDHVVRKMRITH